MTANFALFVHDKTTFEWQNAYHLALAAELSYEKADKIEGIVTGWGFEKFKFIQAPDGTECFIMSNKNIIVVCFRGTDQLEDWITNLDLELIKGPFEGRVHQGFYTSLSGVWQRIERTIASFRGNKPKSLWFTGHSLGAALATLAVARWREEDRPVDGLYTFGQPRTGDREFARNFNFDFKPYTFRFVNNNDIVTRIPSRQPLKYSHVGTFKYFTEAGEFREDISYWNRFLDRMHGRIADILEWGSDGIKDHAISEYVKNIKKALDNQ
ncbi:MAG: lipase family protein [Prochloraceae cyanobacterium]|nr:lipase family protein [Prochloraceae cyanobacterium]